MDKNMSFLHYKPFLLLIFTKKMSYCYLNEYFYLRKGLSDGIQLLRKYSRTIGITII